jgi:hypothetical protein
VEVRWRRRVDARVFHADYHYRPTALGSKPVVFCMSRVFTIPGLELSFQATAKSIVDIRPMHSSTGSDYPSRSSEAELFHIEFS